MKNDLFRFVGKDQNKNKSLSTIYIDSSDGGLLKRYTDFYHYPIKREPAL